MKSRSAIFLIIGSMLWFLFDLNGILYRSFAYDLKIEWIPLIANLLILPIPVGFVLLGYTFLNPNLELRRKIAVIFTALTSLSMLVVLYYRIAYFDKSYFFENTFRFILDYALTLFPLSILIFWIMLLRGKLRKGAIFLFVGSLLAVFSIFSDKISLTFTYGYDFNHGVWESFSQILRVFNVFYPISLVAFAIFVLRKDRTKVSEFKQQIPYHSDADVLDNLSPDLEKEIVSTESAKKMPSMIDWISDFLLAMIPVFGLGFLIWRGLNKVDSFRRNWAVATIFWTIIGTAIFLFIYFPIFQFNDHLQSIFWMLVFVVITMFFFWISMLKKVNDDDFDEGNEDENSPVLTWVGRIFVASLPIVGLICLIIWAIETESENPARKNWAVARLIWAGIMIIYWLFLYSAYIEILAYKNGFIHFQF